MSGRRANANATPSFPMEGLCAFAIHGVDQLLIRDQAVVIVEPPEQTFHDRPTPENDDRSCLSTGPIRTGWIRWRCSSSLRTYRRSDCGRCRRSERNLLGFQIVGQIRVRRDYLFELVSKIRRLKARTSGRDTDGFRGLFRKAALRPGF
jgi:hypothetical protein